MVRRQQMGKELDMTIEKVNETLQHFNDGLITVGEALQKILDACAPDSTLNTAVWNTLETFGAIATISAEQYRRELSEPVPYRTHAGFDFFVIKCEGRKFNAEVQGTWGIYCKPVPVPKAGWFFTTCLLYTSDAADERSSVDLGGRRIIKKKR